MALLGFIRRLFGLASPPPIEMPPRAAHQRAASETTSVLEDEPAADSGSTAAECDAQNPPEMEEQGWWTPKGEPVLQPPPPPKGGLVDQELHTDLTRILDNPQIELPQLPQVAQRALVMLRDDQVNFQELAQIVEQDQVLAADVLRVANSVLYRGFSEIRRLDLAFARLGHRALRTLVLSATIKAVSIRTGGPERTLGEELWRRSLASGVILGHFGRRYSLPEEDAFLVGLLHDIGMLAILKVTHDHQRKNQQKISRAVFEQLCAQFHEHIGLRLADAWNLPEPLPQLISNHHHEPHEDDPLEIYRLLVMFSDVTCAMLEYAPYVPYDFWNLPCVRRLGLENTPEVRRQLAALPAKIAERMTAF